MSCVSKIFILLSLLILGKSLIKENPRFRSFLFQKHFRKISTVERNQESSCRWLNENPPKMIGLSLIVIPALFIQPSSPALATNKLYNLPTDDILKIVKEDITERQALNTADFTREIYDESCQFQDEIDIYPLDQYVKGTKALFNAKKSHVDLTSPVTINSNDPNLIQFQFKEDLAFNFPFLKPIVTLSGKVSLTRDKENGLIVYSREQWNESVNDILKTIHF